MAGILLVEPGNGGGSERRYSVPPGHAEVQTDVDSINFFAPMGRALVPPARVADIGCGTGWSSIGIAKAYPLVTVDGFDLDSASIEDARHNAESSGVKARVKFEIRDAADPTLAGSYDLVTAFETIHDMSNPVGALRAMRGLAKDGGTILIADGKAAEGSRLLEMR